jgi:predicted TPR repeat methyltransferase
MRFVQLLKICKFGAHLTLNDIGCGYGALIDLLDRRLLDTTVDYLGVDLSEAMVTQARRLWAHRADLRFVHSANIPRRADYSVASGVFNVQLQHARYDWEAFIASTLEQMNHSSALGFAVNFLKEAVGGRPAKVGLYTTSPERWATHCAACFGVEAEVVDGYGLHEFTLLMRRGKLEHEN